MLLKSLNLLALTMNKKTSSLNETKSNNVAISKYRDKIKDVKNEKIKKSLTELTKVFKKK
jgi:hypothetical protein